MRCACACVCVLAVCGWTRGLRRVRACLEGVGVGAAAVVWVLEGMERGSCSAVLHRGGPPHAGEAAGPPHTSSTRAVHTYARCCCCTTRAPHPQALDSLNIASKDTTRSAFDMWASLLSTGVPIGSGSRARQAAAAGGPLEALFGSMADFGDSELVSHHATTSHLQESPGLPGFCWEGIGLPGDF